MKNGFAFLQFSDDRDAEDAINALNRTQFEGSELRVEFTRNAGILRVFLRLCVVCSIQQLVQ